MTANNPSNSTVKVKAILRVRPVLTAELERERKALSSSGNDSANRAVFLRHSEYRKLLSKSTSTDDDHDDDDSKENQIQGKNGIIRVFNDLPMANNPLSSASASFSPKIPADPATAIIPNPRNLNESISYSFDAIFNSAADQELIFDGQIKPLLPPLFEGLNTTVFAYGPTSAGKTFTMMGKPDNPGIIPRTMDYLWKVRQDPSIISAELTKVNVKFSLLEIYNEKVYDLLLAPSTTSTTTTNNRDELNIREDQNHCISIPNLTQIEMKSLEQFKTIYDQGVRGISKGATKLNVDSSRSHTILLVNIESRRNLQSGISLAKLHLIDLAGSEDNRRTENTGVRLKESGAINKSLFVLGQVVEALNNKSIRIPYRDSKLTRILQDSLGGKAQALVITNVAPTLEFLYETYRTLNFASKSRKIQNEVEYCYQNDENEFDEKLTAPKRWSTGTVTGSIRNGGAKTVAAKTSIKGKDDEKRNSLPIKGMKRRKNFIADSDESEEDDSASDDDYKVSGDSDNPESPPIVASKKESILKSILPGDFGRPSSKRQKKSPVEGDVQSIVDEAVKRQIEAKFSEWAAAGKQQKGNLENSDQDERQKPSNPMPNHILNNIAQLMTPRTRVKTARAYMKQSQVAIKDGNLEEGAMLCQQAQVFSLNPSGEEGGPGAAVKSRERELERAQKQAETKQLFDSIDLETRKRLEGLLVVIIRTGSVRAIQSLKGIGAKRAQAILENRQKQQSNEDHGNTGGQIEESQTLESLLLASGMTEKLARQIAIDNIVDMYRQSNPSQ